MSFFDTFKEDIQAAYHSDPALKSTAFGWTELVLYQGLWAIFLHRIAHFIYKINIPFLPRLISQINRFFTGIEIHPGATIGGGFFIDHGSGVVIGETAEIGKHVIMYHQVTLGGTSLNPGKRHPTIGDGVLLGAGAKLFGPITVGSNSQIGGGAVLTKNVPENSVVVGNPARIVKREGVKVVDELDTMNLPDPIRRRVLDVTRRLNRLERHLEHNVIEDIPEETKMEEDNE